MNTTGYFIRLSEQEKSYLKAMGGKNVSKWIKSKLFPRQFIGLDISQDPLTASQVMDKSDFGVVIQSPKCVMCNSRDTLPYDRRGTVYNLCIIHKP